MRDSRVQCHPSEPALCGLRLLLLSSLVLIVGCASTTPVAPAPLVDRSAETSYRLDAIADKLDQARAVQLEGNRSLAAAVFDTAKSMLPEDHARERHYVEVLKAGVWAGAGESRDADKARELISQVELYGLQNDDRRLLADVAQIRVVLALADDAPLPAMHQAHQALAHLWECGAYREYVETAGELAFEFLASDHPAHAETLAREGHETAQRLDDRAVLRAGIDTATVIVITGRGRQGLHEAEQLFLEAYEATYRLGDLGWRDIVIASAVESFYDAGEFERVVRWGNRMRTRSRGLLPYIEDARLWPEDYLVFLAQYAFALDATDGSASREEEARGLALKIIEEMPDDARESWRELEEKLRGGHLQED